MVDSSCVTDEPEAARQICCDTQIRPHHAHASGASHVFMDLLQYSWIAHDTSTFHLL